MPVMTWRRSPTHLAKMLLPPFLSHNFVILHHIKVHSDCSFILLMFFLVLVYVLMQVIFGMIVATVCRLLIKWLQIFELQCPSVSLSFQVLPVSLATQVWDSSTSHCLGSSTWNCSHQRRCTIQSKSTNLIVSSMYASWQWWTYEEDKDMH
jgi:hypothetical protein